MRVALEAVARERDGVRRDALRQRRVHRVELHDSAHVLLLQRQGDQCGSFTPPCKLCSPALGGMKRPFNATPPHYPHPNSHLFSILSIKRPTPHHTTPLFDHNDANIPKLVKHFSFGMNAIGTV